MQNAKFKHDLLDSAGGERREIFTASAVTNGVCILHFEF